MGKRVTADWKVVLGESAVDIKCGRLSQGLQRKYDPWLFSVDVLRLAQVAASKAEA
jgi:hypothetical protein